MGALPKIYLHHQGRERKDVEQMLKYFSTNIIKTEFLEGKIYLEPKKSNMCCGLYNNTSTPTIVHG